MRILGIDPGLRRTGYACVKVDSRRAEPSLIEAGVLRIATTGPLHARLLQIRTELLEVLADLKPDHAAVESLFSHVKHAQTAIIMGHARGVLLATLAERRLEIAEFAPAEVKRAVTGRGNATKEQVRRAVMAQCGLRTLKGPHDASDAMAIALTAARRLSGPGKSR
ncbi:MAG: crossover junction endodeoxyribonuclease RuvC [Planctomycetes bacterium]|nr:crossover junction endodeoxyribonuclease RuvC [Planctomycetota bacterium]